jgi:hypothetical protein
MVKASRWNSIRNDRRTCERGDSIARRKSEGNSYFRLRLLIRTSSGQNPPGD